MKKFLLNSLCAASLLAGTSAYADTAAFSTGTPDSTPAGTGLVGFVFTLNQNIDLTQLGFYAQSIGGGDTPHVALLDISTPTNPPTVIYDTGNLVSNVPNANAINYVSVGTPILLTTGKTYEITAPIYFSEDFSSGSLGGISIASVIQTASFDIGSGFGGWDPNNNTYNYTFTGGGAQTPESTYTSGGSVTGSGAHVAADFQYTIAAVPEPQTWAMVIGGAGALCSFGRIRRRSR